MAKLHALKAELSRRKHDPSAQVGEWLQKVVQGYFQYHAVPGNMSQLSVFRHRVCRLWRVVLTRRSQRGQMSWQRLIGCLNAGFLSLGFCILTLRLALPLDIQGKSRMRQRACTDLCGGRSVMVVPTATSNPLAAMSIQFSWV